MISELIADDISRLTVFEIEGFWYEYFTFKCSLKVILSYSKNNFWIWYKLEPKSTFDQPVWLLNSIIHKYDSRALKHYVIYSKKFLFIIFMKFIENDTTFCG